MADLLPKRKSPRWRIHDYRLDGWYFVTLCVQDRMPLFGRIDSTGAVLSDAGLAIRDTLLELQRYEVGLNVDTLIVMPDHLHAILALARPGGADPSRDLGAIVGRYKSLSTRRYMLGVQDRGWPRFCGRLWQRSFYDRVIRDERECEEFREYIRTNPQRWIAAQS
jgi:REP element-mobilizing transposase RayT